MSPAEIRKTYGFPDASIAEFLNTRATGECLSVHVCVLLLRVFPLGMLIRKCSCWLAWASLAKQLLLLLTGA